MARRSRAFAALVALVLSTWAAAAAACPVCFSARNADNRAAFVETTIFMSALPLVLVGAFLWWAARRIRHHEGRASESPPQRGP
nr:MAG: hypothetical protein DIU78_08795 [Pseudomonadota bacterium]